MRLFKITKKEKKKKIVMIIVIFFFFFYFFANISYAVDVSIVPGAPSSQGGAGSSKYETGSYGLNDFIQIGLLAAEFILGIVGSLALLFFMYGGLMMIISQGSSEKVEQGKTILKNAVIGLVIVFTSWAIINFVVNAFVPEGKLGDKPWYKLSN